MDLKTYLRSNGISQTWFAKKTGFSLRTIHSVCAGAKVCPEVSEVIEIATNREVKAENICTRPNELWCNG